jgi:malonyl-CoA O-methyltransferase
MSVGADAVHRDATLAAYERWAGSYAAEPHNPLMAAEQRAMLELCPSLARRRVLDLACGSGRYSTLAAVSDAKELTALDFSPAMLAQLQCSRRVRADMMHLPFKNAAFEVVISGLAVGHATSLRRWIAEIARVLVRGGVLLYSDFHPAAARAGMTRSFVDSSGARWTVPHRRFELADHRAALMASGLTLEVMRQVRVGIDFDESFPGAREFRARWFGLPLILVVRARL